MTLLRFGGFPGCSNFRVSARERDRDGWTDGKRALPPLLLPEKKPDRPLESPAGGEDRGRVLDCSLEMFACMKKTKKMEKEH